MSKTKRTRWTVTLVPPFQPKFRKLATEDGSNGRVVTLAHDARGARNVFTSKGQEVSAVEPGDYRAVPTVASGARPDFRAIQEAASFLGLRLPVNITLHTRGEFRLGSHKIEPHHPGVTIRGRKMYGGMAARAADANWTHNIRLHAGLSREDMGRTLWHELAHAMQFERDVDLSGSVSDVVQAWHRVYFDGTAYGDKPYEAEANSYMPFNAEIPLAR